MEREHWWGIGVMLVSVALAVFVGKLVAAICGVVGIGIIVWAESRRRREKSLLSVTEGWFALEVPEQVHNYIPFEAFIRNCGPRTVRNIRFDPVESRQGLKISFDGIASLAPHERVRLGFRKINGEVGYAGNVVNFFEGGSHVLDQPPYTLTIRFLDGNIERTEEHIFEGHPLPKGGVSLKTYPLIKAGPLPALRAKIVPVRFGRSPDNRHGMFVRNLGEPAFDISVEEPISIGTSKLKFWDRVHAHLSREDGELLMECAIELPDAGMLLGSPRDKMIAAGLERVPMKIRYRDLDTQWVTEFDLIKEFWGDGLRVGSIQQKSFLN
jgi:hypothetical protein